MSEKSVDLFIKNMPELPSMPPVVAKALNIIEDPKSSVAQLAAIISKDISLTTQILKLVNSAYYGFPSQITTIDKAMALLGFKQVKSLILSVALKPMMMSHSGRDLWEHSLKCGVACQLISKALGNNETDEAFVLGLLHDIGKNVIEMFNHRIANEINARVKMGTDRLRLEKSLLGFTHADLGEALLRKWKLPEVIVSCVKFHHTPLLSPNFSLVSIVYIADLLTQTNFEILDVSPNIANKLDFEVPDPIEFREEIIETTKPILNALK